MRRSTSAWDRAARGVDDGRSASAGCACSPRATAADPIEQASALDAKTDALVRIAALVAENAAAPSYLCAIRDALTVGASVDEVIDTLVAVSTTVGHGAGRLGDARNGERARESTSTPRSSRS